MPRSSSSKRTSQKKKTAPPPASHEKWLTDEERQEIREAFLAFATPPTDGSKEDDSQLSIKQTRKALKNIAISLSRDEIQTWVSNHLGGGDVLDWSAFSNLATTLAVQRNKSSLAFSLIDQDQKGVIVVEDLRRVADELGEEMTDEELQEMMEEVDQAGEGLLTLDDFVKIARQVKL